MRPSETMIVVAALLALVAASPAGAAFNVGDTTRRA